MNVPQSMFAPVYRLASRIGVLFIAVFLFFLFAVTGLLALYFLLREHFPREGAMGLIALVAGIASLIAAWVGTREVRPKVKEKLAIPGLGLEMAVRQTVVKDPLGAAIGALAAGLIVSSVPELSRLLQRVLSSRTPPV
jgi:drug/metabolite transporter (DMT)-like permease